MKVDRVKTGEYLRHLRHVGLSVDATDQLMEALDDAYKAAVLHQADPEHNEDRIAKLIDRAGDSLMFVFTELNP